MNTLPLFPSLHPELRRDIQTTPEAAVYHYTSLASLRGILGSRTLWASHFTSLNDGAEYHYALGLVEGFCRNLLRAGSMWWNAHLGYFLDNIHRLSKPELFVCSFSQESDLLSQWRAYAQSGDGVSIGFDPVVLVEIAEKSKASIVNCVYDPDRQQQLVEKSIGLCVQGARGNESESELEACFLNLTGVLSFVAPALKHPSFAEEREWRIVKLADKDSQVQFRPRGSAVVPYLELPLGTGGETVRLESLTLGPTRNRELASTAVNGMLRSLRGECAKVGFSSTPYRSQ